MSTFLELCADVAMRSGGTGRAPSTVVGQSSRMGKLVAWVQAAWRMWQNERTDWTYLKGEWQGTLVAHTATYTGASFNIDRFRQFVGDRPDYRPTTLYDPAIGVADEITIQQIVWSDYRVVYGRGSQMEQRPTRYCIDPAGQIRFGCTPDKAYTVRGEYLKSPQELLVDADIPDLPAHFHQAIADRAILLMAEHDEAGPAIQIWGAKVRAWRLDMLRELTDQVDVYAAGPLA